MHFVYILTNKKNGTLYVGSTSNLILRMETHKIKAISSFTKKYNLTKLIYFELHSDLDNMIQREKRLKNWHRKWKIELIEKDNPCWLDLSGDIVDLCM